MWEKEELECLDLLCFKKNWVISPLWDLDLCTDLDTHAQKCKRFSGLKPTDVLSQQILPGKCKNTGHNPATGASWSTDSLLKTTDTTEELSGSQLLCVSFNYFMLLKTWQFKFNLIFQKSDSLAYTQKYKMQVIILFCDWKFATNVASLECPSFPEFS